MAEPVSTTGASAPTEPPKPMVTELAIMEDHILCGFIMLLRCDMAKSILVTPWLISSLTTYFTNRRANTIPTEG